MATTRKFVYDSSVARVRMVADSEAHEARRRARPLRWLLVALVLTASALAFDAAHAIAPVPQHATSSR